MSKAIGDVNIAYEKNVTSEDVVKEANVIWNELKRRKIHPYDTKQLDDFYSEMVDKHIELARAYPIVIRYMCQLCRYNEKAFRQFIKKMIDKPSRSENDYLDLQAEYIKMLYIEIQKANGTRWDIKTANAIFADARKKLQEEADRFKTIAKTYAEENAKKEAQYKESNLDGFAKFLEENREFFENDGNIPIRISIPVDQGQKVEDVTDIEAILSDKMTQIKQELRDDDVEEF